ncbi:MAG: hypothetical protein MJ068_00760 [Clostridia bacterium]|nr:hypothetical protein [Clostridia bacterium]
MKKTLICILLVVLLFAIVACDNPSKKDSGDPVYSAYIEWDESGEYYDNKMKVIYRWYDYSYNNSNSAIKSIRNFDVNITNLSVEKTTFTISEAYAVRESNGAKFELDDSIYIGNSINLENDMSSTIHFSCDLPTDLKQEKYFVTFKINNITFNIKMYDRPDSEKAVRVIKYIINGKIVKTERVLDKEPYSGYTWFNSDETQYCHLWYANTTFSAPVPSKITESISIYGKVEPVLKFKIADNRAYLEGFNIIPPSKSVIIPATYNGYAVCINNFAINGDIEKIYIEKVQKIYYQYWNKTSITDIYYAGSEEDWKKLDVSTISWKSSIVMHYNASWTNQKNNMRVIFV